MQHRRTVRFAASLFFLLLSISMAALLQAQQNNPLGAPATPSVAASQLPPYLQHAGIDQNLGTGLPLPMPFTDSTGSAQPLSHYFGHKPVVLALVYFHCGLLCPQVLRGMAESLRQTGLAPGKDYDVLVISFDPADTAANAAEQQQDFLHMLQSPTSAGVHFLTGSQPSIDALTRAVGFHYVRVPGPDGAMTQFAHSSAIFIATPDGRMSRYLSGITYQPRDLRLALIDASGEKIGSFKDLVLIYCCNYSPTTGKYTVSILRVMSIAGLFTLFAVLGMIFLLTRTPASMKKSV